MDPLTFFFFLLIAVGTGFTLGRAFQREGRQLPEGIDRFLSHNRSAWHNLRGMQPLAMAGVSLCLSFIFLALGEGGRWPERTMMGMLFLCTYWLLVPAWVYKDARSRGERAWAWGLMTLFTNVLGLFSYIITRPEKSRECRRCLFKLREEFIVCPYCGPEAGRTCTHCQATLDVDWVYCPYCQTHAPSPEAPLRMNSTVTETGGSPTPPPHPSSPSSPVHS